ncbi:MAG: aspartate racemase, partial [Rhodothermales bacterium]
GMGPHAGIYLADRITAHTNAAGDSEHLSFLLSSLPGAIPDRTSYLLDSNAPDPSPAILEIASGLVNAGCPILGMPCNTAHAEAILARVLTELGERHPEARLFHLIEETAAFCAEAAPGATRIGLLATLGTYRDGMYERALTAHGLQPILPDEADRQELIHRALYDTAFGIKRQSSPVTEEAIELLSLATRHLREAGAEAIILGCTELPLAIKGRTFAGLPVVDSTTALARALIRAAAPEKLAPLN